MLLGSLQLSSDQLSLLPQLHYLFSRESLINSDLRITGVDQLNF
tara:strand:- start:343 stop:474 length:132 start_codon:yes stop_codon:yes gene_type:complete